METNFISSCISIVACRIASISKTFVVELCRRNSIQPNKPLRPRCHGIHD